MVDVSNLKRLTQEAIQRGKAKKAKDEQEKQEKEERRLREQKHRAEGIIEQIPHLAEKAAHEAQSQAVVMKMKWTEDYTSTGVGHSRGISIVHGSAADLVMKWCQEAGLRPTVEDWHDGCGMDSGYEIVIHW